MSYIYFDYYKVWTARGIHKWNFISGFICPFAGMHELPQQVVTKKAGPVLKLFACRDHMRIMKMMM